jgi:hypothetical protein
MMTIHHAFNYPPHFVQFANRTYESIHQIGWKCCYDEMEWIILELRYRGGMCRFRLSCRLLDSEEQKQSIHEWKIVFHDARSGVICCFGSRKWIASDWRFDMRTWIWQTLSFHTRRVYPQGVKHVSIDWSRILRSRTLDGFWKEKEEVFKDTLWAHNVAPGNKNAFFKDSEHVEAIPNIYNVG